MLVYAPVQLQGKTYHSKQGVHNCGRPPQALNANWVCHELSATTFHVADGDDRRKLEDHLVRTVATVVSAVQD